jgi:hypothetical protein
MPWKELSKMDERMRFVARLMEGEKMEVLCREFDISRKTGYKLFNRYKNSGIEGLTDRNRRPYRHANRLPFQIEKLPAAQGEALELGSAEDPGQDQTATQRDPPSCHQHRPCGIGSTRPGQQQRAQEALQSRRHDAQPGDSTQRSVVRRLQG